MHCVSVAPRIRFDAGEEQSVRSLTSRFGPTVPVAPAAASVWHPLHPAEPVNTAFPADAAPAEELEPELELDEFVLALDELDAAALATLAAAPGTPGCTAFGGGVPSGGFALDDRPASQRWNTAGSTTYTGARIRPWPAPQSSVHSAGYFPSLVGVTRRVVVMPGTASSFSENSGTKKLWITSSERSLKTTGRPSGRYSAGETLFPRLRVREFERELPLGDVDRERVLLVRLVAAQHAVGVAAEADEQQRRKRRPDHLEPGVTVDRRAVDAIVVGLQPELPDRVDDHRLDEHEDRHRGDQEDGVEGVDVAGLG